jgi:hypothetical protein
MVTGRSIPPGLYGPKDGGEVALVPGGAPDWLVVEYALHCQPSEDLQGGWHVVWRWQEEAVGVAHTTPTVSMLNYFMAVGFTKR